MINYNCEYCGTKSPITHEPDCPTQSKLRRMTVETAQSDTSRPPRRTAPNAEESSALRSIDAICIVYIIFGVLISLGGAIAPLAAAQDGREIPPLVFFALMLAVGIGMVISAIGVRNRKRWAILPCNIVSAMYLFAIPIGTVLGAYFLFKIGELEHYFE